MKDEVNVLVRRYTHKHTHTRICIYREKAREREFLAHMIVGLASPKSIGQASRPSARVRVHAAILSLNSAGQQAGNSGRVSMLQFWG